MKFHMKLVAVSMSILGWVSYPVFADDHPRHNQLQRDRYHVSMKDEVRYKDMPEPICTISPATIIYDTMSQNVGRAMPDQCNPGWFERIRFAGGINLDVGKFGSNGGNFMGVNANRFSLNDAYLNMSATVNEWVHAFASLSYSTATTGDGDEVGDDQDKTNDFESEYSAAYTNNANGGSQIALQLEQAYFTIGNLDEEPFFLQAGKQFQDFSRYEIHPITRSLTQVLSETLATSIKVGFLYNGFNGSIAGFDIPIFKENKARKQVDYTAALGYDQLSDSLGFDLGVAYMNNLIGVNDVAYRVHQRRGEYHRQVDGIAAYADVNSGPFSLGLRYTTALQRFKHGDLPISLISSVGDSDDNKGAEPWAGGIEAAYSFTAFLNLQQNLYVGWQISHDAVALGIPRERWLAGYDVSVWDKTTLGIEYDNDRAYGRGRGGSGNNYNLVTIRAGVEFS